MRRITYILFILCLKSGVYSQTTQFQTKVDFGQVRIYRTSEITTAITNPRRALTEDTLMSIRLTGSDTSFRLLSISETLPFVLKSNTTVRYRVRFHPTDTLWHSDTLWITLDSLEFSVLLRGKGSNGCIVVSDVNFGKVVAKTEVRCIDTIRVSNISAVPLQVRGIEVSGSEDFRVQHIYYKGREQPLPFELEPNTSAILTVCYLPTERGIDSAVLRCITDVEPPILEKMKDTALLTGKALGSSIRWSIPALRFESAGESEVIKRIYLHGIGVESSRVSSVFIEDHDTNTGFSIYDAERPLTDIIIDAGDSVWFAIKYTTQRGGSSPARGRLAAVTDDTIRVVELEGYRLPSFVENDRGRIVTVTNPVVGNRIQIRTTLNRIQDAAATIVDINGVVRAHQRVHFAAGVSEIDAGFEMVPSGIYYLLIETDGNHCVQKILKFN